jgi:drug/metabolite transporter (DMT)-like permease
MSAKSRVAFPVGAALLSAALFGAATPASKHLLRELHPFALAGLLYLGAAIAVAPLALRRRAWRLDRRNALRLGGAVFFGGVLGPVLLLLGLRLASAASVSMWLNLEMVATAVLGVLLFRDHLGRWGWLGAAGVVLACAVLSHEEGTAGPAAGLLVAAGCICWGLDNHLTALIDGITPTQSTLCKGLVAGSVNLGIGLTLAPLQASVGTIGVTLCVGGLCYGASIALYITAAQQTGATRAQMVFASAPFFGVAFSALALGESLSAGQLGAGALLIGSLVFLFRDRHSHEHVHPELTHTHMHRHDDDHHNHVHPDLPPSTRHSHEHEHERIVHAHPHWPDLHHRHDHA